MVQAASFTQHPHAVEISVGLQTLPGILVVPENAQGIVIFAHGSGSSRLSPRNRFVAQSLNAVGLGTLLFDLLTTDEESEEAISRAHRFNIGFLADRLAGATYWVIHEPRTQALNIGYFGASTGAAAALVASAMFPGQVDAIVSRGGRPDLAGSSLSNVKAPTLLIVGSEDCEVIDYNQHALGLLKGEKKMILVSGATHLFEEPGTLEKVAKAASHWFLKHLNKPKSVHQATNR